MIRTYEESGVSIEAGDEFVDRISRVTKQTYRSEVISGVGGFGALFALSSGKYREPILVSSTDGVGTKLKLAIDLKKFDTVGQDLVAMCVNDICCSGAEPLFFLDYFATGKLKPADHLPIVEGIANACKEVNCSLIGGETAEMPGMYHGDDLDLAGFSVGVVERASIIDGSNISIGDTIIGVFSSGFHSNGYSLVRALCDDHKLDLKSPMPGDNITLGDRLLTPTILYPNLVTGLMRDFKIKGVAHITGGGLTGNVPRILPESSQARINLASWERPALFRYFQELGRIEEEEMLKVFNCGIGLVIVVGANDTLEVMQRIKMMKQGAAIIGEIVKRQADNKEQIEFV